MLDLEVVTPPTENGLNIVSLVEMKKHLRITQTALDDQIEAAVREAGAKIDTELNRSIFPRRYRRYLSCWPASRIVQIPYPPTRAVIAVSYGADSPRSEIGSSNYVFRTPDCVSEIVFVPDYALPTLPRHPRAVSIEFDAGYTRYPDVLKRFVKVLGTHYVEHPEATLTEVRAIENRAVQYAIEDFRSALGIPVAMDDWE